MAVLEVGSLGHRRRSGQSRSVTKDGYKHDDPKRQTAAHRDARCRILQALTGAPWPHGTESTWPPTILNWSRTRRATASTLCCAPCRPRGLGATARGSSQARRSVRRKGGSPTRRRSEETALAGATLSDCLSWSARKFILRWRTPVNQFLCCSTNSARSGHGRLVHTVRRTTSERLPDRLPSLRGLENRMDWPMGPSNDLFAASSRGFSHPVDEPAIAVAQDMQDCSVWVRGGPNAHIMRYRKKAVRRIMSTFHSADAVASYHEVSARQGCHLEGQPRLGVQFLHLLHHPFVFSNGKFRKHISLDPPHESQDFNALVEPLLVRQRMAFAFRHGLCRLVRRIFKAAR